MRKFGVLVPVLVVVVAQSASAAQLIPALNTLGTTVTSWMSTLGLLAFLGAGAMWVFASDHHFFGSMTHTVVKVAAVVGGAAFLTGLGLPAAQGAWLF